MPESPTTPSRRRRSSGLGSPLTATTSKSTQGNARTHSRVSSIQSIRSNTTQRPASAQSSHLKMTGYSDEPDAAGFDGSSLGNGLGSLADELAEEEWDEDADGEETYADAGVEEDQVRQTISLHGLDNEGAESLSPTSAMHERPNGINGRSGHKSKPSDYDGSDYGDSDDLKEVQGISPSLEQMMSAIESLARQGAGTSSLATKRDLKAQDASVLGDLGSQYSIESHITRLSTAHNALTMNLSHQSRTLATLSQPLSSPFSIPPEADFVDELVPLIEALFPLLPQPPASALSSIHHLHVDTDDLLETLSTLADSLHMIRQTTNVATRKLREARENTAKFREELDEAEQGRLWLEKENRHEKLQQREAAAVCKEVVGGFEEFCEDWRKRLLNGGSNGIEVVAG